MAFPQSVLPVRVKIAPGGRPAGDPADWQWVDIAQYVRVAAGITIETGRSDESQNVDSSKCTMTLDNRTGDFSTRNITGQWYGLLKKNTPLRVSTLAIDDAFARTTSSSWGSTPDGQSWTVSASSSVWSTNGTQGRISITAANASWLAYVAATPLLDVDVRFAVTVPAVMTGASQVVGLALRLVDSSHFYYLSIEFDPAGALTSKIVKNAGGGLTQLAALQPIPALTYTAGSKWQVRAVADGPNLRVKVWADGGTEPAAWTVTAADTTYTDAGQVGFLFYCVGGNTNTKPFTMAVDDLQVEAVEFTGTVPEWPPRWDQSQRDATTPIVASGILRRMQQGKSPIRSAITRRFQRSSPVAHWTLEDNSGAITAEGLGTRVQPASARAAEFGSTEQPLLGAAQVVKVTDSTVLAGTIPAHLATGTWGFVWYAYLLAPPAARTTIMTVLSTGTVRQWTIDLDATSIYLSGFASDGTQIISTSGAYPAGTAPPVWTAFDLLVEDTGGGNIQGTLLFHAVTGTAGFTYWFIADTAVADPGRPHGWRVEGSLGYNGGYLSQIAAFNYEPVFVDGDFTRASNGYIGEVAADRVTRLCAEEGIQVVVEDGDSEPLGPQRVDTILNLLLSAQDADMGILYERGAGLGYRPRGARYNRPVELDLDFAAGHISAPPEPTDDDQRLRNQVTVTRDDGSSATVSNQTSIDESDLYDDSKTINVETDWVLPHHASARVALGTVDELRWPSISINLARNPALIAAWRARTAFPRMRVVNEPAQVTGNPVDQIVEGIVQTIGPKSWDLELACSPAKPWDAGIVEDTDFGRADTDGAELRAEPDPTATSLLVDVVAGPRITTDPAQVSVSDPIYVTAATGEQMAITAVSGTSNPQTLTVIRGLAGYAAAIPAGTDLRLTTPMIAAL